VPSKTARQPRSLNPQPSADGCHPD
jgi:hypothetical protein